MKEINIYIDRKAWDQKIEYQGKLFAEEAKISAAKIALSKDEIAALKLKLKAQYELDVSIIKLEKDGIEESAALALLKYQYQKKLAEMTIPDKELLNLKLLTIENNLTDKLNELWKKYYKDRAKLEDFEGLNKARVESQYRIDKALIEIAYNGVIDKDKLRQKDLDLEDLKYKKLVLLANDAAEGTVEGQEDLNKLLEALELEHQDKMEDIRNGVSSVSDETKAIIKAEAAAKKAREKAKDEVIDMVESITDAIVDAADRRVEAIQREIDASNTKYAELQRDRDHEWEKQQEGYANDYTLKQKELDDEKKRQEILKAEEEKALRHRKKMVDLQIAMDMIMTQINLALAASEVFKSATENFGWIGVAVGAAATAAMIGSFAAFKANAKTEASGYAEGEIDINGVGTETSDSIPANLSRRESVMTAKTTKHNKRTLGFMQDNPTHPLFRAIEKNGVNNVFNKLSDDMQNNWTFLNNPTDNKWDEKMYNELKSGNDELRSRPYSYMKGGKLYTIEGNQITQTTIRNG